MAAGGVAPVLAVVLVGSRKDSQTYVNMKAKACVEIGIEAKQFDLPESTTTEELLTLVDTLNKDVRVNGILVQLPLPKHCDADAVIEAIDPSKDADGLTTNSAGQVARLGDKAPLIPCTPLGCLRLLDEYEVPIAGANAVVIGRSNLVGKPAAQLLMSRSATVTVVHSKTRDIAAHLKNADIVVAAIGKANFVQAEWLKPGCTVIDVGINAVDDSTKKSGYRLVGDVDYAACSQVAGAITPVPGGVGPMTVAMLMRNTVESYKITHKIGKQ